MINIDIDKFVDGLDTGLDDLYTGLDELDTGLDELDTMDLNGSPLKAFGPLSSNEERSYD